MHPLVEEAMRGAAVAWLEVPGQPGPYPVWCQWFDGALYLARGGDEQPAPGLDRAGTVQVSARGDHGGTIVTWTARAGTVTPGGPDWDAAVPRLAGRRLNAGVTPQRLAERWAADPVTVHRLVPDGPVHGGRTG